jgi:hypothetical protein
MICSYLFYHCNIDQLDIPNKPPFIGLFNHTKIFGPGLIIKKLAGGQKLTLTLEHSVCIAVLDVLTPAWFPAEENLS